MVQWNPSDYAAHSSAQFAWAAELLEKLSLRTAYRVLDIGCGDGKITAAIARRVPDGAAVGVDSSEEMIGFARMTFPPEVNPNLSFRAADARELPFGPEFDVVFSNAALHWIPGHRPVLAGIARSLRPGGRILLQMAGSGNAAPILEVVDDLIREPEWRSCFTGLSFPFGFYEPEEYRGWLAEAGLIPRRVDLIPRDMVQQGAEGLAGWVRTTWMPYTGRVPEDARERFIGEITGRYLSRFPLDGEGRAHVPMMRLEVEAGKE